MVASLFSKQISVSHFLKRMQCFYLSIIHIEVELGTVSLGVRICVTFWFVMLAIWSYVLES